MHDNRGDFEPHYVKLTNGRIHYISAGDAQGQPLVLLHQVPRTWDEFSEVIPLLRRYRIIAPDLPGYGASDPIENTIPATAGAVLELLDMLSVDAAHVVGHHGGALVAFEMGAQEPGRVLSLTLSSVPYIDAAERARRKDAPGFNSVQPREGGEHLAALWRRRAGYLTDGAGSVNVLNKYIADAVRTTDPDRGIRAVSVYRSEDRLGAYAGPVLEIASAKDERAFPRRGMIRKAAPQALLCVLERGDIATPETRPNEFAEAIEKFIEESVRAS